MFIIKVCSVVFVILPQDMYIWPDEPFEEMDSTLAVQQVKLDFWQLQS